MITPTLESATPSRTEKHSLFRKPVLRTLGGFRQGQLQLQLPNGEVLHLGSTGDQGPRATIAVKDGKVTIDGANVVKTDIATSNGVIHVIDAVILPKE